MRVVAAPLAWQRELADVLGQAGVDVVAYVPDARLRGVVDCLDRAVALRALTREEECVAYACGYAIAGGRALVMMQCSGLGNALNALGSLALPYGVGLPLVLSMRGTLGEANAAQVPMGRATPALLGSLGIQCFAAARPDDVAALARGTLTLAYEAGQAAALVLEPTLGGGRERA
jgi:sulfopyruvate decarboxylase subunit alpha